MTSIKLYQFPDFSQSSLTEELDYMHEFSASTVYIGPCFLKQMKALN